MSDAFFEQLWIPAPDHDLGVGSGSHAQQTAAVMQRLEPVVVEVQPDLVLTYGDVTSTVAAALVAAKLQMRVGHVEAGLRSRAWTMPEEIKRVVTDRLSDLLFLPSRDAAANLEAEGIPADRMHFVGNVMIDTLCWALPQALLLDAPARFDVEGCRYAVVTLHRPANVDDPAVLRELLEALARLADRVPVLFPVHPRTRAHSRAAAAADRSGPAADRAGRLSRHAEPRRERRPRGHRFGRAAGGDLVPRRAMPHGATEYGAPDHLHAWDQSSRAATARCDSRGSRARPRAALTGPTRHRAVGRPGRRADRASRVRWRALRAGRCAGSAGTRAATGSRDPATAGRELTRSA